MLLEVTMAEFLCESSVAVQLPSAQAMAMANSGANAELPVSLLQDGQQFFHHLLSRDLSNLGDSGRVGYKSSEAAGSVPFQWEAEPGKPKSEFSGPLVPDLPPLSLPPSRQSAVPSSSSSASQSPKSITGKMKNLILSGKFSGPLVSNSAEPSLHGSSSKSRRGKRSSVSSDGSVHRASFASSNSGAFPSKFFGKVEDDNSPTSTLDYNSDRYSPSSSPLYYSPLYSSSSPSVSQNSAPLSPSGSVVQSSAESVSSTASSGSTSSNAGPAVLTNCVLPITSLSNASPAEQNRAVMEFSRHSSDQPPKFFRDHPELLFEFISRGALSKSLSTARVSFADERRALSTMFFSGPQVGCRTVSFNPGMRDPTCSSLDKLFPLKSPNAVIPINQHGAPENRQHFLDAHESLEVPCVDSITVGRNDERPSIDRPAEELIKLRDDGNAFAYGPVSSAFVFGHRAAKESNVSSNFPRQPSSKRNGQPALKSILKKSRSTGGYSHELTAAGNDLYSEQPRHLDNSSSQKISSVLLRFAEAEEKLFNSRRQAAEEASDARGPACLPVCSFLGRAFLCRSKLASSRNSDE